MADVHAVRRGDRRHGALLLWFFWQTLTGAARNWLEGWAFTSAMYRLFDSIGFSALHAVIAPFFIVIMAIPLIVVTVLLLIATLSMPVGDQAADARASTHRWKCGAAVPGTGASGIRSITTWCAWCCWSSRCRCG